MYMHFFSPMLSKKLRDHTQPRTQSGAEPGLPASCPVVLSLRAMPGL